MSCYNLWSASLQINLKICRLQFAPFLTIIKFTSWQQWCYHSSSKETYFRNANLRKWKSVRSPILLSLPQKQNDVKEQTSVTFTATQFSLYIWLIYSAITRHTLQKQMSSTSHLRSLSEATLNSWSNLSYLYGMTQISSACMHSKHLSKVSEASLSPEENTELF